MVERAAEVRITKLAACGIFLNSRIQIADAWTTDACRVVNLEAMRIVKLISRTQVRHPIVQVAVIVGLHAVGELGIEATILIAQSGTSRPVALTETITQVGGCHMGAVVEKRGVVHFGHTIKFKNALALVEAIDILQACLNGVILGKWARPVELKCVLGKGLFGVGGLSSIREWTVKHFAEGIDALHIIMTGREHVTEC